MSEPYRIIRRKSIQKEIIDLYSIEDVNEAILNGTILVTDGLLHSKLTEGEFREIQNIQAFEELLKSDDFWLQSQLQKANQKPYITTTFVVLFLIAYGIFSKELPLEHTLHWTSILWDNNWWNVFISGFLHVDLWHLCSNLLFFVYVSYFFERVASISLYLQTCIWGSVFTCIGIALWGQDVVIGASFWIYSLLGSLIFVGWRCARGLHKPYTAIFGWGAYCIFVILFLISLPSPHVSQISHLAGFLAGILSVALVDVRDRKSHIRSIVLALSLLSIVPYVLPQRNVKEVFYQNVQLNIPKQHSKIGTNPISIYFDTSPSLYVESSWNIKHELFLPIHAVKHAEIRDIPTDLMLTYYKIADTNEILIQRTHQIGEFRRQILCLARNEYRIHLCETWLKTAVFEEPSLIQLLRERVEEEPESRRAIFNLAEQLMLIDSFQEADQLAWSLQQGNDMLAQQSAVMRLKMRSKKPDMWNVEDDLWWIQKLLHQPNTTDPIHIWSCLYFSYHKKFQYCEKSSYHIDPKD